MACEALNAFLSLDLRSYRSDLTEIWHMARCYTYVTNAFLEQGCCCTWVCARTFCISPVPLAQFWSNLLCARVSWTPDVIHIALHSHFSNFTRATLRASARARRHVGGGLWDTAILTIEDASDIRSTQLVEVRINMKLCRFYFIHVFHCQNNHSSHKIWRNYKSNF